MTITAEDVIYGLGLLVQEGDAGCYHVNVDEARVLLAHIEFLTAKIADMSNDRGQLLIAQKTLINQATLIAEKQAVIDQRNGECDRLINELAALRQSPAPVSVPDVLASIVDEVLSVDTIAATAVIRAFFHMKIGAMRLSSVGDEVEE